MDHEVLKIKGELGDVAILEQPQGCYQVEVYWRPSDCRKTLIETDDLILAKILVLHAMENL